MSSQRSSAKKSKGKVRPRNGGGILFDDRELSTAIGEKTRTIRTWRKNKIIPAICCGYRSYRFRLDDVLRALEKRTVKAR